MFTFLKQTPHEEDLDNVDNHEEIADKNDNGESILQSNYVNFSLILVAAVVFCFIFRIDGHGNMRCLCFSLLALNLN